MVGVCEAKHTRPRIRMSRNMLQLHGLHGGTTAGGRCYLGREEQEGKLTTAALVLHADVLLVLAGVLVELALVAVVLPVAAAHRLLGSAQAAQGAHALGCQAVRRLHAGASVAAGHLGAGVLQSCRSTITPHIHIFVSSSKCAQKDSTPVATRLGCRGNGHFHQQPS